MKSLMNKSNPCQAEDHHDDVGDIYKKKVEKISSPGTHPVMDCSTNLQDSITMNSSVSESTSAWTLENSITPSSEVRLFSRRSSFTHTSSDAMKVLGNNSNRKILQSQAVQEMTVNKLQFSKVELVGREKEVTLLKQRLNNVMSSEEQEGTVTKTTATELILIRGISGSGKSALADVLANQLKSRKRGVFVRGKFAKVQCDQPYSTIISAIHDLGTKILDLAAPHEDNGDNDNTGGRSRSLFREIQDTLRKKFVTSELHLLVHAVPLLGKLLSDNYSKLEKQQSSEIEGNSNNNNNTSNDQLFQNDNKELLESSFRKFFRVVSSYFAPLILCLDDLQWSDAGTLAVMRGLVLDKNPNLMIVGCYRSNEVDETHILTKLMQDLKARQHDICLNIHEIECGDLGVPEVNQVVMTLTSIEDEEKTLPLAKLCHSRTNGNAFFLLLFVDMLYQDHLLTFHLGKFCWEWDIATLQTKTSATSNVVDLMAKKINKSSPELIHLLKLACCLGTEFSAAVLLLVWSKHTDSSNAVPFEELLQEAIQEKFLERCDEGLRWVHDKVQETVVSLDPEDILASRQEQVGKTLLSGLDAQDLEEALFVVVDLLNCGSSTSLELAELNLRAAKKAKTFSAFGLGGDYAVRGIQNLDPNHCWDSRCKDLALDLYSLRSEAASVQGDFYSMNKYCEVVLNQEECSIMDKIPCYDVQIHCLARTQRLKEAMNLGIEVLGKLGCKLPLGSASQALAAVAALLRFKGRLKKITPTKDGLSQIPPMSDPVQKQVMRLLSEVGVHAYLSNTPMIWILSTIRMVNLTLQYGLADQAQTAFASAAIMIMHALGDWKMGVQYAELSMHMHRHLGEHVRQSAAICISRGMILSYMQPLQAQLKFLMDGYKKGMEVGDIEWAFGNIAFNLEMCSVSGHGLESLLENISIYLPQFEALNASHEYASMTRIFWQASLNLMGHSSNTTSLSGEAMDEEEFLQGAATTARDKYLVMKSFLCVYFGDHEQGAKLALERGNSCYQDNPGQPCITVDPFLRSFSLFALARQCKPGFTRRKYTREAKKARKMVKAWVKKGNPNVYHHLELLNAESAALAGQRNASELYSNAARMALRSGWIHDAALASERHAEYLALAEVNDKRGAAFQMKHAIERYIIWGATRKVNLLREKHGELLSHLSDMSPF